jgi:hypothetical protein
MPGTNTCQIIDHVLVDTGSIGLRLPVQGAAGGKLDPTAFPLQVDASKQSGNVTSSRRLHLGISIAGKDSDVGEIATTVPGAMVGLPIQIIMTARVPAAPSSCSLVGSDVGTLTALGAYGVLGVGNFQQDCGPGCVSGTTAPNLYYACATGTCNAAFQGLPQQVTNPAWALPFDNNGVLIQMPSVPSGGTTTVTGNLIFGIGTQTNNALGSATVRYGCERQLQCTTFNGISNACSTSTAARTPTISGGIANLVARTGQNSGFNVRRLRGFRWC